MELKVAHKREVEVLRHGIRDQQVRVLTAVGTIWTGYASTIDDRINGAYLTLLAPLTMNGKPKSMRSHRVTVKINRIEELEVL